jgi:hypothetical protein
MSRRLLLHGSLADIPPLYTALRILKNSSSLIAQQCATALLGAFEFSSRSSCHDLLAVTVDRLTKLLDKSVSHWTCQKED